jgi:tetratricopeptide (TPR) repeat protein
MKPSVIQCSKCGYQSNIIGDVCLKCGAPLVKICGNCGAVNSVEKNYCDSCGSLMQLKVNEEKKEEIKTDKPEKGMKIEFESIHETVASKDDSFRRRNENKAQDKVPSEPKDARVESVELEKKILQEHLAKSDSEAIEKKKDLENKAKKANKNILFAILFVIVIFISGYLIIIPRIPKIKLIVTANKYLSALKQKKYINAYSFLSTNSKTTCPFTDYLKYNEQYYSKIGDWDFKNIKIHKIDDNGAVIKYSLREGTSPWKDDYISFVMEHDRWVRPYIWNLFAPIDEAIAKGDYPNALFLSQKLYLTDPVDPRTSGYLCSSEYLMGLYDKSIESCKRTIELQEFYPVGFSQEEILWYKFYYADSMRFLSKFDKAIESYIEIYNSSNNSKMRCPVLISKADAYVRLEKYDQALNDLKNATSICREGINKKEAEKRYMYMTGNALDDAIQLAKKIKLPEDNGSSNEKNKDFVAKDSWQAEYVEGPIYKVVLTREKIYKHKRKKTSKDIYNILVNIWTGTVKLEN